MGMENFKPQAPVQEKVIDPEATQKLEQAKKNEEHWAQKKNELQAKQFELGHYDDFADHAKRMMEKVSDYETQYQDLLDKEITIYPGTEKHFNERISFKGLSESENQKLAYDKNLGEVAMYVLQAYESKGDVNENPQRIFQAKKDTTLRQLFTDYKYFLEGQLAMPKPTQAEIDANQTEVNMVWDSYKKSQDEVKSLEPKTQ